MAFAVRQHSVPITCPFCGQNIRDLQLYDMDICVRAPCNHLFCSNCIQKNAIADRIACPKCNSLVPVSSMSPIHSLLPEKPIILSSATDTTDLNRKRSYCNIL